MAAIGRTRSITRECGLYRLRAGCDCEEFDRRPPSSSERQVSLEIVRRRYGSLGQRNAHECHQSRDRLNEYFITIFRPPSSVSTEDPVPTPRSEEHTSELQSL